MERNGNSVDCARWRARFAHVLACLFAASFVGAVAISAIFLLYWAKSAAGIDLFDGHFILHGWLP